MTNSTINISDISAIEFVKGETKFKKQEKVIKQKVDIDFLYEKVLAHQKLSDELENYELAGFPEENTNNLETLHYLLNVAEVENCLGHLLNELEEKYGRCERLEEERADAEYEDDKKNIMSCETHLNPIRIRF